MDIPKDVEARADKMLEPLGEIKTADVLRRAITIGLITLQEECNQRIGEAVKRGQDRSDKGQFRAAAEQFLFAQRNAPTSVAIAMLAAQALVDDLRFDEGIHFFEHCLVLDAEHREARMGLAHALKRDQQYENAVLSFDIALKTERDDPIALFGRAESLRLLGMHEESLPDYEHVLTEDRGNFAAIRGLAQSLNGMRDFDSALPIWRQAIELAPADAVSIAGLKHCESWIGDGGLNRLSPERQLQRERDNRCIQWRHRARKVTCDNPVCPGRFPDELAALEALNAMRAKR